jgi:phage terminase large subunit-like protein
MRAGPKAAVDESPLPWRSRKTGGTRVKAFVERFVVVPKGAGARRPMRIRAWQARLLGGVFDEPRPRLGLWSLPRGNGKSALASAIGLYGLHGDGVEGARVVVVASDERQAGIVFHTAVRMTELSEPLLARTQMFQDRLVVPATGSEFRVLPAEPRRLEGLDPSLAIVDEIGVVDRRVWEVIAAASGKRDRSLVLAIGTPSPDGPDSVMWMLREAGLEGGDPSFAFAEFAAGAGCELDDEAAWRIANPALGDFLHADAMCALLPPKLREATFRRARLGQWVDMTDEPWLPPGAWDAVEAAVGLPDGIEVVLGFDGSFNGDVTALVAVSVAETPHIEVVAAWERPLDAPDDWQVPIFEVEDTIRAACGRWQVREIAMDLFRWARTAQVLEGEGLPVVAFPQSPARMTPATTSFYEAVVNRTLTQSGDPRLARHIGNCVVRVDSRGTRLTKEHKHSLRRVDLAVAAVMAHSRATWLAGRSGPQLFTFDDDDDELEL